MSFGDFSHQSSLSKAHQPWDKVTSVIFGISSNTTSLERYVEQLGSKNDTHQLRNSLHQLMEETLVMVKTATDLVKPLLQVDTSENLHLRFSQAKVQKEFEITLKRFQDVSKESARKTREFIPKSPAAVEALIQTADEDEENQQQSKEAVPLMSIQQLEQRRAFENEIEFNEAILNERDQELRHIEQSILEVNEIFRDLGQLVHDQQYMLDNIESNVEGVAINLENATHELSAANQYQKRARKRMFWLILIATIIVLFVLIFVIA